MDIFGNAIADYHKSGTAKDIIVHSETFDDDVIPVSYLFRDYKSMPDLEKKAMQECKGSVLDVGASAGCHSLYLQSQNKKVHAIDISPLSVDIMKERGVDRVSCIDFYDCKDEKYDTLLLLMNGSGIIGNISSMKQFFNKADELLNEGGQILLDSSDLIYLFKDEYGIAEIDINDDYYGEVRFFLEYKGKKGKEFDWLYIDFDTLSYYAEDYGFECELIMQGKHYDYLARITRT